MSKKEDKSEIKSKFDPEKWKNVKYVVLLIVCYADNRQIVKQIYSDLEKSQKGFVDHIKKVLASTSREDKLVDKMFLKCVELDQEYSAGIITNIDIEDEKVDHSIPMYFKKKEEERLTLGSLVYSKFSK